MKSSNILLWIFRILPALIMIQSLFFKFSGSPESIYIFTKVGMEPWGRYGTGIAELIASILILIPRTSWIGAFLGAGVLAGALVSHLTVLGIQVKNTDGSDDGGQLFIYALVAFLCCIAVLFMQRKEAIKFIGKFVPIKS
jgi:uncharacterized membrane protein YphA (DoxX/SURF4 family)